MLPPERSTRTSLVQLAAKESEDDGMSNDTSSQSRSPKPRRAGKAASAKQSQFEDKKARRKLTAAQKEALEELATCEVNPSLEERRALSLKIGLELKAVSVWFQNKRRPTTVNRVPIATIYTPAGTEDVDSSSGRVVFGNVANNLSPRTSQSPRFDSEFNPESEDISSRIKFDTSGIWDYLPSSSPTLSQSSSVSRFDDAQDSDATPTSPTSFAQTKKYGRKSLEWACKNDASMRGKLMKRRIQTFLKEANDKMSIGSPTRKRQRTDVRPSQPPARLRKRERRRSDNFKRLTIAATAMEMHVERDVYDVAVALMELKGRHGLLPLPVRGRKSI